VAKKDSVSGDRPALPARFQNNRKHFIDFTTIHLRNISTDGNNELILSNTEFRVVVAKDSEAPWIKAPWGRAADDLTIGPSNGHELVVAVTNSPSCCNDDFPVPPSISSGEKILFEPPSRDREMFLRGKSDKRLVKTS
jgi:hypothetical protein